MRTINVVPTVTQSLTLFREDAGKTDSMLLHSGPPRTPPGSVLYGSLPRQQRLPAGATAAAVRGGPGERRPLWRGRRGPCPGRWACGGRPASAGRFSGRPGGTGSRCRSWRLWTRSLSGPWADLGETLHWLQRSRKSHKNMRDSRGKMFIWEGQAAGSNVDSDLSTSGTDGRQGYHRSITCCGRLMLSALDPDFS